MASDPSEDLDESAWQYATVGIAGVYRNKETIMWKKSFAYYKKPEDQDKDWLPMKDTGQWTLPEGC
ncbi:hypothetical protein CEP52_016876 [Fusarium oligoseptatum]|uniref:Uncharacterized protein n=1 Tax=Fusarium oligoseptatum TaxID=2604345 RepID=A0A428RZA1_9HYPO|nr:hypothetical protein CEP52_016876 [Fusarium oligoseptatum]